MKAIKLMLTIIASLIASQMPAAGGEDPINLDLEHFLTEIKAIIEENLPLTDQEKKNFGQCMIDI